MPRKKKRLAPAPPPPPPIEYVYPMIDWLPRMRRPEHGLRCCRLQSWRGGWLVSILGRADALPTALSMLGWYAREYDVEECAWWIHDDGQLMSLANALPCVLRRMDQQWRTERTARGGEGVKVG